MIHLFEGDTADQVWQHAAQRLRSLPGEFQAGRGGPTQEILHTVFQIYQPQQKWVYSRVPAINPAFAIAEIVWILRGRSDAAFLAFWNSQLSRFVGDSSIYHGAYGFRLRKHFGFDQFEQAFDALAHNRNSRQIVLQIWDPVSDFPTEQGVPTNADIPCNITSILKVRNNCLDWVQINRSNDLFRGVPYNFVQFTTLQEVMAGWLGIKVGSYIHFSDSLHLYVQDSKKLEILPLQEPLSTDSLSFPKEESDRYFEVLESNIQQMISPDLTPQMLDGIVNQVELPCAFENLRFILAAECARRHSWIDLADILSERCNNPMLRTLWSNWKHRLKHV